MKLYGLVTMYTCVEGLDCFVAGKDFYAWPFKVDIKDNIEVQIPVAAVIGRDTGCTEYTVYHIKGHKYE